MPQYTSKNPGLQIIIRDQIIDPVLSMPGRPYIKKPVLVVEFGEFGASHLMLQDESPVYASSSNPALPNTPYMHIDFQGGFIDTASLFARKKADKLWDDEDCELVLMTLEDAVTNQLSPFHGLIARHEMPAAVPPWPTYDSMDVDTIPEFATNAGMVVPALIYERATLDRPDVVEALTVEANRAAEMSSLEAPAAA